MLTPEYMRQITEGAESIAEQMHQDIIDAMVRRIMQRLGRGDDYLLTSTDKWMIDLLRDSGMLLMDIQEALAKRSGTMEEEIAAAMRDAGVQSLARDDAIYKKAGLSVPSLKQSPYILRLMQRDYEKTSGLWRNMTGTTAEASQRLFIDEMDKAYRMTATGAVSYTKAFGDAIDRIVRDGVKVQYPSGHIDTLETAALRALRTGIGQMSGDITVRRMEEMDWDIVLVSAHMGARPGDGGENPSNHAWWQGKYYSLAGKDKRFPLLREATGYGTGEGLMGWNCRHSFGSGTGDPKDNPFTRPDTEENKKAYRVQQNQRAIERGIRKLKRECMGLNSAIEACQDPAMKEQLQAGYDEKAKQLKDANKEYAEYCDKHGTKQLRERIQIARWDRKQADEARKAAWREEKKEKNTGGLLSAAERDKIEPRIRAGLKEETKTSEQKIAKTEAVSARIRKGRMPNINPDDYGIVFADNTRPEYPPDNIMAGKGCKTGRKIDDIERLVAEYQAYEANAENWAKRKARYWVYDEYGEMRQIEVHWYEHPKVGKTEDKVKFDENGEFFVDLWKR